MSPLKYLQDIKISTQKVFLLPTWKPAIIINFTMARTQKIVLKMWDKSSKAEIWLKKVIYFDII